MTDTDAVLTEADTDDEAPEALAAQPDLVTPSDPDWTAFKNKDESWFLKAASDEVRRYCGWHLSPSITSTETKLPVGERGILMLPTRYLTAVTEVKMRLYVDEPAVLVDADTYEWFEGGWIEPLNWTLWPYQGAYYYGEGPAYMPVYQAPLAEVTFTHGWAQLPADIKEVVMELSSQAMQLASHSNVEKIESPGFMLQLKEGGLSLSPGQMNRLASYRVRSTA